MKRNRSYVFSSLGPRSQDLTPSSGKPLIVGLALGVGLFFAAGALMGGSQSAGSWKPWYDGLSKVRFTPPAWIFGPVWLVLYSLMGMTFGRLLSLRRRGKFLGGALGLWALQMAFNLSWSPVFFRWQSPFWALMILMGLVSTLGLFLALSWRRDKVCFWLNVPYGLWSLFALILNAGIVALNPGVAPKALVWLLGA